MPKPLTPWFLLLCLGGTALLHGCESSPAASDAGPQTGTPSSEPIRLTEAPVPPGVPVQALTPIGPEQGDQAQQPLDELLDSLDRPAHLRSAADEQDQAAAEASPPLAAQQFFATGRQALLDGDNFAAVQAFDKALRLSPDEAAILRGLGQAWARAGNRVSAANYYRRAYAADPTDLDSAFMLGRFALEDRRWDAAILNFDAAHRLADAEARDTGIHSNAHRLTRFYLANALNQGGYARAAVTAYQAYLADLDNRLSRNSRYARELSIIDAQQGETLALMGDLLHRLDEPESALEAYERAAEAGVLNPDALLRRLLYTRLRLGQSRAAEGLVAQAVAGSSGDPQTLELIEYAVAQGVPASRLTGRLTRLYQEQGKPTSLALALADVLPEAEATALLSQHLASHPGDDAVFGKLLAVSITEPLDTSARETLIDRTVTVMSARPNLAGRYADQLLENLQTPASLLVDYPDAPTKTAAPESADVDATRQAMTAYLHGRLLAAAQQPEAAADAYREALDHSSDLTAARLELAAHYVERGDYEAAEQLLLPLGDNAPVLAIELRVRALTQTGRYDEALDLLNRSADPASPSNRLKLEKADLLIRLGRISEAERTLLDALNARPTDEDIYAALLKLYEAQPDLRQNQIRLIRRMIETIPNARITRFIKVEYLLASRNYNEALQLLNLLEPSADGTDAARIVRFRLEAYIGLKQPNQVIELAEQHLSAADGNPDNELLDRAIRYLSRSGEIERAVQLEEKRWIAQPPSASRSQALSEVYFVQERYDKSAVAAREALSLSQTEEDRLASNWLLIRGLFSLERADEAEQTLASAIEGAPENGERLCMFLAVLYEQAGDTAASRRVLEAGLAQYPMNASMNNTLGYGLANDGVRLDDARKMIERALATQPDVAAYLDSMGWVYYKLGDFEEALDWLEKSQASLPGEAHPVILDHVGDTLYRLGRKAEGVRVWNQARLRLLTPGYVREDPEEEGLEDRLAAKIQAVAEDRPAPVAALGDGVSLPEPDGPNTPDPKPEPAAINPAEADPESSPNDLIEQTESTQN